jgi:hypothetical protein|tara:strand:+ start:176 stop:970 length:795 start_codon:yes stop_codon:yes gene_type:complete
MKLPNFLKPKFKCDLIRLGKKNDGGYVIPKMSLKNSKLILGFGLGEDWSFEEHFKKLSGARVMCFDNSVNLRFWIIKFFKDIINLFLFKKKTYKDFTRFFTYIKYKFFFNGKSAIHKLKIIAPTNQNIYGLDKSRITDLNKILDESENCNFFLKVDIEQHEYRILDQIIKHQKRITGLAIEFHECDLHFEKIKNFVNLFELQLVHIHVNNFGTINSLGNPTVLELTFSPKQYNFIREKDDDKFPVSDLDQPNNDLEKDTSIVFE